MVNLASLTSFAGALTLVKIIDFQGNRLNLNGGIGAAPGNSIISWPETPGALNEDWFLIPNSDNSSTFTIQSLADSNSYFSYAAQTSGVGFLVVHSQVVVSGAQLATNFTMQTADKTAGTVSFLQVGSDVNAALTAWQNPTPSTRGDPSTPLTFETLTNPVSLTQGFIVMPV
ncbi:hypothetical protein DFH09DRAFT_1178002, partial [Mycena vulgaris]